MSCRDKNRLCKRIFKENLGWKAVLSSKVCRMVLLDSWGFGYLCAEWVVQTWTVCFSVEITYDVNARQRSQYGVYKRWFVVWTVHIHSQFELQTIWITYISLDARNVVFRKRPTAHWSFTKINMAVRKRRSKTPSLQNRQRIIDFKSLK